MATELIVLDQPEPCPYVRGRIARLPLRMYEHRLSPEQVDKSFALGMRRLGSFLYRPECPTCKACVPIRLETGCFTPNRTQRRTLRRNDRLLRLARSSIVADQAHVDLCNRHRTERKLDRDGMPISLAEYRFGFGNSCAETFELSYWMHDRLCAVSICDQGADSLSAVYTYYDPSLGQLSLGTYAILKQWEYCLEHKLRYLYLGFYIAEAPKMSYKASFQPYQLLLNGQWSSIDCDLAR